jgi:hypothetical protein
VCVYMCLRVCDIGTSAMRRRRPEWGCSGTERLKSALLGSCYWWRTSRSGVRAARTSVGGGKLCTSAASF